MHNAGLSGDGAEVVITRSEAIRGLRKAIYDIDVVQKYPDPTRTQEIKAFLVKLETVYSDEDMFTIWYS